MENEIVVIEKVSNLSALDSNGKNWWDDIPYLIRERAMQDLHGKGKTSIIWNPSIGEWQRVEPSKIADRVNSITLKLGMGNTFRSANAVSSSTNSKSKQQDVNIQTRKLMNDDGNDLSLANETALYIHNESIKLKPDGFIISDLNWKMLNRNALLGKNLLITGPSGAGKTTVIYHLARMLERPIVNIPLGNAQQDPKALLLGSMHYNPEEGTFFGQSAFISAIQEENAIILLDEISRPNPEAWNLLLPALDPEQRFVRLDDMPGSPIINVHPTVSFFATANIGNQYTATKVLDKALVDRFNNIIDMPRLSKDDEFKMLRSAYPSVSIDKINLITQIVDTIRDEYQSDRRKISTDVSARTSKEMAEMIRDGFSVLEACEGCIYPLYSADGSADSERIYVKQLIQSFIPIVDNGANTPLFNSSHANT